VEEGVIKKRGDREMIGSVSCENVGSNILRKETNLFRHVCLSVNHPSIRLHGTTRLQLEKFS